jgi:3-oxoadipate CoA-transferase alpha subunit
MICSFPRSSDPQAFTEKYLAGEIELELVPQGTLAVWIRAAYAGMSGARIFGSAALELKLNKGKRALATMCIGVGQGLTIAIDAC